uniref:Malectin-like domain-containing protein n=1 Tax=Brassica oleracea TaxID=3712 RepID=A0A3P6EV03_BRAOL|nr:unnamed protein product [Brassica oleracea]
MKDNATCFITFNLNQVSFAAEGLKDAQQTVMHISLSRLPWDLRLFGHHHQQGRNFLRKEHHFLIMLETYPLPSRNLSRNKLNGTIPVSLTGLPNLINLFIGNNLNCGVGQPHPCVSEVARSGDSSKPKTGIIAGVVVGVTVVLFGILVFLFCKDRHKGFKRDVFVDVADSGAAQNINIRTRMNLKVLQIINLYLLSRFAY